MKTVNGRRIFEIDIRFENGHLHEVLRDEDDRLEMIDRMEKILQGDNSALRKGLIQVLVDQARDAHQHQPLIVRSDVNDELHWMCSIDEFYVNIDQYPDPSKNGNTPKKNLGDHDL